MIHAALATTGDAATAQALASALGPGCRLVRSASPDKPPAANGTAFDVHFLDLSMILPSPGADERRTAHAAIAALKEAMPDLPIIVMARPDKTRAAVEAVQAGADNYLSLPLVPEEVRYVMASLSELKRFEAELKTLRDAFWQFDPRGLAATESSSMRELFQRAKAAAPTSTLVLITGETGTGKSVLARLIHDHSKRKEEPFISVHCGAIPDTLIESELFGHEKGAFTGAIKRKAGKFELAHRGTVFLDEIATLTPAAQVKLLTVLQDKTFQRVGGEAELRADVRVIAATNQDLAPLVKKGDFRADLFYRLNVFPLDMPPLRKRKEDIPHLVATFLARLNAEYGKDVKGVDMRVMEAFSRYDWPGNVRELENLVERAYILEGTDMLRPEGFPADLVGTDTPLPSLAVEAGMSLKQFRDKAKDEAERLYLEELLARNRGRMNVSAAQAGLTSRQLRKLMAKHRLRKEDFKS